MPEDREIPLQAFTAAKLQNSRFGASITVYTTAFSARMNTWMSWRLIWGERCGKDGFARWYQLGPIGVYLW